MIMAEKNFRGFAELAKAFNLDLNDQSTTDDRATAGADADNNEDPQDLVAQLKKLRVDPAEYPALRKHHFNDQPNQEIINAFESLGDKLYHRSLVDKWYEMEKQDKLELARLINLQCAETEYQIADPCLIVLPTGSLALPILPSGYGFKGGVARKALAQLLRLNANRSTVRDMDVIFHGETPDPEIHEHVAKSFMQDDWIVAKKKNRIIAKQPSLKGYLRTHEFTINQLMLSQTYVFCTAQCLSDLVAGVIRPTKHHLRKHNGLVDGIVAAKAVRFFVEGRAEGRRLRLDHFKVAKQGISKFHLAVHFGRALEHSESVGIAFLEECIRRKLVKFKFDGTVRDAIHRLKKTPRVTHTLFPS